MFHAAKDRMIRTFIHPLLCSVLLTVSPVSQATTDTNGPVPAWMSDWTLRLEHDLLPNRLYAVRANASGLFINVDGALVRVSADGHEAWQFHHCTDCGTSVLNTERIYDFLPLDDGGAWVAVGTQLGTVSQVAIQRVVHIEPNGDVAQEWTLNEALGSFGYNVKLAVRDQPGQTSRAWLLMGTEDGIKRLSFDEQHPGSILASVWSPGGSHHSWMVSDVVWSDAATLSIHLVDAAGCAPLMPCPSFGYLIHWADTGSRLEFPYYYEYGLQNGFLLLPNGDLATVQTPDLEILFAFMHGDGTFSETSADFPALQSTYGPTVWASNENLLLETELDGVLLFNTEGALLGQFDDPQSEVIRSAGKQLMVAETFDGESPYTRMGVHVLDAGSLAVVGTVSPTINIPVYEGRQWLVGSSDEASASDVVFAYQVGRAALILQRYSEAAAARQARLFSDAFENATITLH